MEEDWVEKELAERGWRMYIVEEQEDDEGLYTHELTVIERIEDDSHVHTSYWTDRADALEEAIKSKEESRDD